MEPREFPFDKFMLLYPDFGTFSEELILAVADAALCFVNNCRGVCIDQLWMLLVAHMLQLRLDHESSPAPYGQRVSSASIDKVSVSFTGPPAGDSSSWWFGLTPWGQQYILLNKRCAMPFYISSLPERSAFRSVGGIFPNGGRVGK
jgi:hypothetical protein